VDETDVRGWGTFIGGDIDRTGIDGGGPGSAVGDLR
jgi:hypothetical protein